MPKPLDASKGEIRETPRRGGPKTAFVIAVGWTLLHGAFLCIGLHERSGGALFGFDVTSAFWPVPEYRYEPYRSTIIYPRSKTWRVEFIPNAQYQVGWFELESYDVAEFLFYVGSMWLWVAGRMYAMYRVR